MSSRFEFQDIPKWFAAIFGLTYLTGYLIDRLYYSSFGIIDAGEEFIKLRHIHIGLMFLFFFLIVIIPVFFLVFGRKLSIMRGYPNNPASTNIIGSLTSILYFGSIFCAVVFSPPGYFSLEYSYRLSLFFIIIFSGLFGLVAFVAAQARRTRKMANNLLDKQRTLMHSEISSLNKINLNIFTYFTFFFLIIFDYFVFKDMLPELKDGLYPYGIFFFLFCFLFSALLYRIFRRLELDRANMTEFARAGLIAISALGLLILYYTAVVGFTYTIFPHISNINGGANYRSAPFVSISLEHPALINTPPFVLSNGQLRNLVVLYTTSTAFYFADACDLQRGARAILHANRSEIKYIVINPSRTMRTIPDCPPSSPATNKPPETSSPPSISPRPSSGSTDSKP
jgi:hypothetical protein